MKRMLFPSVILTLTAVPLISHAQQASNPDSALQAIMGSLKGSPLRLEEARKHGLTNATAVRKAEADYLAALGSARREAGAFDPELFFQLNHLDQQLPTASFFAGAPVLSTQQTTSRSGLRMSLPVGTQLELSLSTTNLGTNSTFAFLNPEYDTYGSVTIRQPLLGGFAASARKQLTHAEREAEAERARYDQQVVWVSSEVERTYWDLYAAERDFAVQRLTRDRAEAFLSETEIRFRTGLVGPNQVANARTFLAEQQLLLIDRDEQLSRQSDVLASLIGVRPDSGAGRFIPLDEPPGEFPLESEEVLVVKAQESNLDLEAARRRVDAANALASAAGWEALPSVNLVGSLGGNGLGGGNQPVIFGADTLRISGAGSFSNAITQVAKRQFPTWSLGVEVSIPLGFRSGLGEKDRLEAQVMSAEQDLIEQSRAVADRVRSAYNELSHGKDRITAARAGVEAAQEQVRVGLIEFHNGRVSAFELVRLGEDFAVAQQRYSAARVRTAKAAATLRQLTSGGYSSAPH